MRMSKQEFDATTVSLQQNRQPGNDRELELHARVVMAACAVIKQRQGIPDDVEWNAPPEPELMAMMREFLAGISPRQRKLLKRIAEGLELEKTRLH
jgi:isopenicillin N synthase-like dioxygenase